MTANTFSAPPITVPVEHVCGHATTPRQLEKRAKEGCLLCRASDAAAYASVQGWPKLTGPDEEKVARAELSRAKLMKEADLFLSELQTSLKAPGVDEDVAKALLVPYYRARALMLRRDNPGWWTVRFRFSGKQVLQAFAEHLVKTAREAMPPAPRVPRELLDNPRYVAWQQREQKE